MRWRARRVCFSGAVAISLLLPHHAAALGSGDDLPVKVYRGTFQAAEARWLVRSGRNVHAYLVFAYRMDKPLRSSKTFLIADRSRCRLHGPKKRLASCSFGGRRTQIPEAALRFDPLITGASLRYRGQRIDWVGGELQEPAIDPWIDPQLMEADAYLERLSSASGRLLGDRMSKRALDHATLSYGLYAGAMVDHGPDRRPHRKITLRLPRGF
ncbi:MAG: hypothetical protein ACLGIB_11860 [Actinomycetota bacterium]